jgi:hypothetical protein
MYLVMTSFCLPDELWTFSKPHSENNSNSLFFSSVDVGKDRVYNKKVAKETKASQFVLTETILSHW